MTNTHPGDGDYTSCTFEELARALDEIRRQHDAGEPLVWQGPERLHHCVSATSPPPSWHFGSDGMEYHRERGRGFWDVYTLVSFQLGYHNGYLQAEEVARFWEKDAKFWKNQAQANPPV